MGCRENKAGGREDDVRGQRSQHQMPQPDSLRKQAGWHRYGHIATANPTGPLRYTQDPTGPRHKDSTHPTETQPSPAPASPFAAGLNLQRPHELGGLPGCTHPSEVLSLSPDGDAGREQQQGV